MSQISARREAAGNAARQHWVAERLLDRSPSAVTHLRPTFFAEWLINMWDGTDEMRLPFADGRHAPIAAVDQARVIAAILEDPAPHAGTIYRLYGAVELNHYEIAEAMARALGREVTYVPIGLEEFTAALDKRGASPHLRPARRRNLRHPEPRLLRQAFGVRPAALRNVPGASGRPASPRTPVNAWCGAGALRVVSIRGTRDERRTAPTGPARRTPGSGPRRRTPRRSRHGRSRPGARRPRRGCRPIA